MDSFLRDVRFAFRLLLRRPSFAAIAVATIGLGIGANVAVFTLVNAVLLHPLPLEEPERLVNLYTTDSTIDLPGFRLLPSSYRNWEDYRERSDAFEDVAFSAPISVVLSGRDEPEAVAGYLTSASYFDVLGVELELGRGFASSEGRLGAGERVVVLSHALWSRRFGADRNVLGRSIRLNGEAFTVIGVAPAGFRGTTTLTDAEAVWVPTGVHERVLSGVRREAFLNRRGLFINAFGRLRADVSFDEASERMRALGASLEEEYPGANASRGVEIGYMTEAAYGASPYRSADESGTTRRAASVLMAVSGLVLLIACVNLANLLLARGADREKEMSLRAELGATPRQLGQQLLVESVLLASLGGLFGLGLAAWGRDLLWRLRPPQMGPASVDLGFDGTVLAYAALVTLATGVLFGIAPAVAGVRTRNLEAKLKRGGRQGAAMEGGSKLRASLVAIELALAFVTLFAAGLFLKSLTAGQGVDPGFDADGLATFAFDLQAQGYEPGRGATFQDRALERLRGLGGIEGAALSQYPPVAISPFRAVVPEGEAEDPTRFGPSVTTNVVSEGYFETVGIRPLEGRTLDATDRAETRPVAVVSMAMAERFWPGEEAVGKRFRFAGAETHYEIVGVVEDAVVRNLLADPVPVAYFSSKQTYVPAMVVTLRASGAVDAALASARQAMRDLDPNLAVTDERAVAEVLDQGLWAPRVGATLLGLFGILALVLSAIGVYGVLSHTVARRTQEVGIRIVFGASRPQIYGLLLRQGMLPALFGLGLGIVAALALSRQAAGLLFRTSPNDAATLAAVAFTLLGIALAGCYFPVRRAARLEPTQALRSE